MWAERKDTVHLTINLPNPVEDTPACSLSPSGRVVWVGTGGPSGATHRYRLDIQLIGGVEVAAAKKAVGARAVVFRLPKAEKGYWGKLSAKKDVHCHVDWSMWKDEDEEEEFDFGENWNNKDMGCLDYGNPDNRDISSDSDDDADDELSSAASPTAADGADADADADADVDGNTAMDATPPTSSDGANGDAAMASDAVASGTADAPASTATAGDGVAAADATAAPAPSAASA